MENIVRPRPDVTEKSPNRFHRAAVRRAPPGRSWTEGGSAGLPSQPERQLEGWNDVDRGAEPALRGDGRAAPLHGPALARSPDRGRFVEHLRAPLPRWSAGRRRRRRCAPAPPAPPRPERRDEEQV